MNGIEMSNEFDVLYNNIMSNQAPGIDEYEKSVLLTKAQYEILKSYFEPRSNKLLQGFDGSEQRQMDFSRITKTCELDYYQNLSQSEKFDLRSKAYIMPPDCFIIINEQIFDICDRTDHQQHPIYSYTIEPITYQKYASEMTKPYKYPPKNIVWRLITQKNSDNRPICEIIGKFMKRYEANEGPVYKMRYLRKPNPIILIDLQDQYNGLTIENETGPSECELPDDMHHAIVQRAVELAVATYNPQMINAITGIGNISSTNLGIIPQNNKD